MTYLAQRNKKTLEVNVLNLANQITLSRILLVPIFMVFLLYDLPYGQYICAIIFVVAALTDGIDGYVARKYNQITNFGKFVDPLADKLLVSAALIGLVQIGRLDAWFAVIIISREFMVTSLRVVAISEGKVIAAGMSGKVKTVMQIVAIVAMLIDKIYVLSIGDVLISTVLMTLAVLMTVYSGVEYIAKNWSMIEFR